MRRLPVWSCGEGWVAHPQKNPRMGVRGFFRSCQAGGAQIRRGVNIVGRDVLEPHQWRLRDQKQMVIFEGSRLLTAKRRPLGQELLMAD